MTNKSRNAPTQAARGDYSAPRLSVYGKAVHLTAAGVTGTAEQTSGQGSTTKKA